MPRDQLPLKAASAAAIWLDRTTPPRIATLVVLSGLSALNMNMILPALPDLAAHFGADYGTAALSISAYLALTGVLQLAIGPLSDRFGRRPVILWSLAIFLAATVGCILAPNITVFLLFRLLQSTVASGIVLSRAVVRDTVSTEGAASQIGYVTMGMSLMPMLAPAIGGLLVELRGWQAVMEATLLVGVASCALIWADLGETNASPSRSLRTQFEAYPELLRSAAFWAYSLSATLASGSFFAFLGGGPWVATEVLGMRPSTLGLYFGIIALGYLIGNFLSGRFAARFGLTRMILAGSLVTTLALAAALALLFVGAARPTPIFVALGFMALGNGLLLPSANAGIVSVDPRLAGSASGLGGAMMIGGGAALSVLAGALLVPETGAWPLFLIMFATSVLGVGVSLWVRRLERSHRGV